MAKRVFYSFHYKPDNWRVATVRSIGAIDGNKAATDNDWESVTKGGDAAIKKWIDEQMSGRGCCIVLIGAQTAGRKWIKYEIEKAWREKKAVLGIHVHKLLDKDQKPATKGKNPFDGYTVCSDKRAWNKIVPVYDPAGGDSKAVYKTICDNIETWIDHAYKVRKDFKC